MTSVLIVSRTRMRNDRVCVGGHDLDSAFRSLRLLHSDGTNMLESDPLQIGDVWDMAYKDRRGAQPPHVEDVLVAQGARTSRIENLEHFLRQHVVPWTAGPHSLFDGTVKSTPSGTAYVPDEPPLPVCSTGYWIPDSNLSRRLFDSKTRFIYSGGPAATRFSWVGMEDPPDNIAGGRLVRVSLARLFNPPSAPSGYYVQISGVY